MKTSALLREKQARKYWKMKQKSLTFPFTSGGVVKKNKRMVLHVTYLDVTHIEMLTGKQLVARMDYSFIASSLSLFQKKKQNFIACIAFVLLCMTTTESTQQGNSKLEKKLWEIDLRMNTSVFYWGTMLHIYERWCICVCWWEGN